MVVTGASAGVGRAVAQAFARRGARVALLARASERLDDAAREVQSLGGEALALAVDVANADAVENAAAEVESRLGPIDVWINNAMASVFSPVKETPADEFRRVTDVTYLGYVHGTLAALKRMLPRDRGRIVQVGSALAYRAIPAQAPYCAAKHAIKGFTDALRCELLHDKSRVRVTMVHLPAINTPQFDWVRTRLRHTPQPVPPIYQPEVAAAAIVYAADHPRREILLGASTVAAVWANTLMPGLVDRYLARRGYRMQEYNGRVPASRRDNLYESVPLAYGAHGDFDARAHARSAQWWLSSHRLRLGLGALGLALGALAVRSLIGAARS